jgi:tetratricopeptide (TPR) repeat protein
MNTGNGSALKICGSLQEQSLPDVMRQIYVGRRTGELLVIRDRVRRRVFFEMGRAVFATSNRRGDRLGALLVRRGDITPAAFEMVDGMIPHGKRFGGMLVEMGLITEEQLNKAVREQILSIIYSLFECTRGEFEFTSCAMANVPEDLKLELSMADLILEGVGRIRDLAVVRRGMGDLNRLIAPSPDPLLRLQQASLKPHEQDLLSQITEPTDLLGLLVFSQHPAADTIRALYGLISAGFLTWVSAQAAAPLPVVTVMADYAELMEAAADNLPAEPAETATAQPVVAEDELFIELPDETAVPEAAVPIAAIASSLPAAASVPLVEAAPLPVETGAEQTEPDTRQPEETPSPKIEEAAWRREVEEIRQRVLSGDPYLVFGLDESAGTERIRATCHELLRRYHPDKFRQASQALREEVEEVFKGINVAWNRVQAEARRRADTVTAQMPQTHSGRIERPFAGSASHPPAPPRADVAFGREIPATEKLSPEEMMKVAEAACRSGISALMAKKYAEAAELLQKAANINPANAKYHSVLALALASNSQRSNSKVCREAEQHYLEAIRLNPQDPYNHALLGLLYSKLGMSRRAESVYRQALRLDPRNEIALKGLAAKPMGVELLLHLMAQA